MTLLEALASLFKTKPPDRPGVIVKFDVYRLVASLKKFFKR